jgi:hypothetical protein
MSIGTTNRQGRQGPQAAKLPAKAPLPQEDGHSPCTVMIEVPVSDVPMQGYQSDQRSVRHLEVQLREPAQAKAFMRIRAGLYAAGAKLLSGMPVASNADCLRWMIEQVGTS